MRISSAAGRQEGSSPSWYDDVPEPPPQCSALQLTGDGPVHGACLPPPVSGPALRLARLRPADSARLRLTVRHRPVDQRRLIIATDLQLVAFARMGALSTRQEAPALQSSLRVTARLRDPDDGAEGCSRCSSGGTKRSSEEPHLGDRIGLLRGSTRRTITSRPLLPGGCRAGRRASRCAMQDGDPRAMRISHFTTPRARRRDDHDADRDRGPSPRCSATTNTFR